MTAVIQRGTLKRGDYLIAGTAWGKVTLLILKILEEKLGIVHKALCLILILFFLIKVRAMFDEFGDPVQAAPPSTPVEILGFREIPSAGDELLQVKTEVSLSIVKSTM